MIYKNLVSALVLSSFAAGAAQAAGDISSPVYLPDEMETLSDTGVKYSRTSYDGDGAHEDFALRETALIGLAPETAAMISVSNRFNFEYLTNEDYNNDLNLDYELGVKKNLRSNDGLVVQIGGSYYTYNPRSWYGRSGEAKEKIRAMNGGNTRWYKELRGEIKAGYELEDGLLPYASFGMDGNIDDANRELYYTALAGVHKLENSYSFGAALRYEFDFGSDKVENWYMQGESDYFLTDNMTLGGCLDYRFAGAGDPKVDYGYDVEARFKILF